MSVSHVSVMISLVFEILNEEFFCLDFEHFDNKYVHLIESQL